MKNHAKLTPREQEVMVHIIQGRRNKEIAQLLFISQATVRNHLTAIREKLGVSTRTEAVFKFLLQGENRAQVWEMVRSQSGLDETDDL